MAYVKTLICCALLGACGTPGSPDAGVDAGEPRLEIGTGEGTFSSFEEGATLELFCGTQGAQHVWIALRAQGIDPRGTILDLSLFQDADPSAPVSQTFVNRVSLQPVPGEIYSEVYGLTVVVPEPDRAIGEDLTLRVRVTSMDESVVLTGERDVRVDWSPSAPCSML
jgi:hypothetical protein